MILSTITLHNFMSYGDATLDFSSLSVACISGPNGAGKSSLLDAITWALWECARASSDELIRLGEREMWVDLCFLHEGHRYRVRRSRQKASSKSGLRAVSKGTLEFQVWRTESGAAAQARHGSHIAEGGLHEGMSLGGGDEVESRVSARTSRAAKSAIATKSRTDDDGAWRSLTAGSMRDTQKCITDTLRMDFDTFVNSAYLRQGRADEFTLRAPSERKQVLADILGLAFFDTLQERAKDKIRILKSRQELIESAISSLGAAENEMKRAQDELAVSSEQFSQCAALLRRKEQEAEDFQQRVANLGILKEKIQSGERQLADLRLDVVDLQSRERDLSLRRSVFRALVERSPEIQEAASRFDKVRDELEAMERKAVIAQELSAKRLELQTELARHRSKLELDLEHAQTVLQEQEERSRRLTESTGEAEKIEKAYSRFRDLLCQEANLSRQQESFVQLSQRANELHSLISEARIRLEAEAVQREVAVSDLETVIKSKALLESQCALLQRECEELERLEAEFELVEQRGLTAKSQLESTQLKVEEMKRRQAENLEKIAELNNHCDSSICPLCSAPIVDRAAVIQRYRSEIGSIDIEISNLLHAIASLETERNNLRREYLLLKRDWMRANL